MKTLTDYIKQCLKAMCFGLFLKTTGTLLELLLPWLLSTIIDDVVPTGNTRMVMILMALMMIFAFGAWALNIMANRKSSAVSRDITRNIRHDLFENTLYLSCEKTDEFTIPSLESRLTSDTYNVHRMISMLQRMGVRAPISMVGGIIMTFLIEPTLALVFLAVMPFMVILVWIRATKSVPLFTEVQKATDRMVAVVRENAQGIRVIKALSRTEYERGRYANVNHNLKMKEVRANTLMASINPFMNLFLNLGMIGVILVGAWRVNAGISESGKILAFLSYFQMISRSLMAFGRIFIMYSRGIASSNRIMEVINSPTEKDWQTIEDTPEDEEYTISFDHVTFSYLGIRNNLNDLSFRLKKGQSLGLIGATGSGKTTVLSLLLHFYHPTSGTIRVNGKDIRSYEPSKLRSMFGIVMQNDFLFAETLKENITFGREISDEDLHKAIANAQAGEFVDNLEDGGNHMLTTKGTNLSGGQRQRVLLSRAFAGDPQFLLLDDSSSALDYQTDAALRKAMARAFPDATRIIIAQRVSAVRNCDQIIVLDHGNVSGCGSHDELLKTNELYASIAESQMGGALFD